MLLYLVSYKIFHFYKNHSAYQLHVHFLAKPTLLTIHFREHRAEVVKHPPLQHFLYKFSDFVNDRPHELGEQCCKLWDHRLRHDYDAAARHELLDALALCSCEIKK